MIEKCEHCNQDLPWHHARTTLIGGVHVYICTKCCTEFDQFIRSHEIWQKCLAQDARGHFLESQATAQIEVPEESFLELEKRRNATHLECHAISETWLNRIEAQSPAKQS